MTLRWPEKVLIPATQAIDPAARSLSGSANLKGSAQVAASSAGTWTGMFGSVAMRGRKTRILVWRSLSVLLYGRTNPVLVPRGRGWQPVPAGAEEAGTWDPVPHGDTSLFDDGAGYESSSIDITVASDALAGATTIEVDIHLSGTLEPGQDFSLEERLYRISGIAYAEGGAASITFLPPLREDVLAGTVFEMDDPVCRMRLASDGEMSLPLELLKFAAPSVNFLEDA